MPPASQCPDFSESTRRFQAFLRSHDWPEKILWIDAEAIVRVPGQPVAVVRPLAGDGSADAEVVHEIGRQRNLGVSFHAVCTLGDAACATVSYPSDEREAELQMYPSDGSLKMSAALPRTEGTVVVERTPIASGRVGLPGTRRPGPWAWLGTIGSVATVVVAYVLVRWLLVMIRVGDGGKLHRTGWGYKTSAYAVLATFALIAAAVPVGLLIDWIGRRDERELLRRYGKRPKDDAGSPEPR